MAALAAVAQVALEVEVELLDQQILVVAVVLVVDQRRQGVQAVRA